jgi:hypothetical protein
MTELNEAPWFDSLSDADKAAYIASAAELVYDLRKAATFLNNVSRMRDFPVRSYQPDVHMQYFVQDTDEDPAGLFAILKQHVLDEGGTSFDRPGSDAGTVQHFADLPFGSGRVAYRVVWIERTPTDG